MILFAQPALAQDWVLHKQEDGILVYTKANGTDYPSIKVVGVVKTSMSAAVSLIMNVERFPEWIYKCRAARVLEKRSDTELIHYQVNSVPFAKDRDMVIHLVVKEDSLGDVMITQHALPDFIGFEKDLVRIPVYDAEWRLRSVPDGIEVLYTIMKADPGGDLPKRLINKAMIEGPFQTNSNMKRILEQNVVAGEKAR